MPTEELKYVLTAQDKGVAKALGGIKSGIGGISAAMPGALGPLADIITRAHEMGQHFELEGRRSVKALAGIGAAGLGAGLALQQMGSGEKAATGNLRNAIENLGLSWEDYDKKVEETIKTGEHFGQTAATTQNVLATLTQATNDPALALKYYNTVLDLSVAKHEDAQTAATQLSQAYNGSARILHQFGISGLKGQEALDALAAKLKGDASTSADTFSGHVDALRAKVEDAASSFGNKFGAAITNVSGGLTAAAVGFTAINGALAAHKAKQEAAAIAAAETAAALEAEGAAAETSGGKISLGGKLMSGALSGLKAGGIIAAAGLGIAAIGDIALHVFGDNSVKDVNDYTAAIEADSGALGVNTAAQVKNKQARDGTLDAANKLGLSIDDVTKASLGDADALARLRAEADKHTSTFRGVARVNSDYQAILDQVGASAKKTAADLHIYALTHDEVKTSTFDATQANADNAQSLYVTQLNAAAAAGALEVVNERLRVAKQKAADAQAAIDGMNGSLKTTIGIGLDRQIAKGELYAAVRNYDATVKKNKGSMDPTSDAGLADLQAKKGVDDAYLAYAQAITGSGLSHDKQAKLLQDARAGILAIKGAAKDLGTTLGALPNPWLTVAQLDTKSATLKGREFKAFLATITDKTVRLDVIEQHTIRNNATAAQDAYLNQLNGQATHSKTTQNNFNGPIHVTATDPTRLARELENIARHRALVGL